SPFSSSGHAGKFRERCQEPLTCLTHLGIGFDAENLATILQQHARPNAGAGSDVSNHMPRCEATLGTQGMQRLWGISRPVENIVFDTIGESAGGVGSRHEAKKVAKLFILP